MKLSKEVKTGILVLLGIILFIYGFNYLKGQDIFTSEDVYYTEFDYNALSLSSPVTIRGNAVGKVKDISYDFKTGKTKVEFTVNPDLKFSKNSTIRLYETGLMGGNALAIVKAKDEDMAKSGDLIASEVQPGLITSLSKNFSGISGNLDSTLQSADTLLVNLNKLDIEHLDAGLKQTIIELNKTLIVFQNIGKKNDAKISNILTKFTKISEDLSVVTGDLKTVEFSKTVAKLDNTLASLNGVLVGIEKGEGSIGKLLKDDQLYNNIEGATKEMEALLKDIKLHPKRYFRILSKKEIPYTEDETN